MSSKERGLSPSEQILNVDYRQKLRKIKEPGALKRKVFLFEHSHAAYDPSSGLVEIIRSRSAEREVEKNLVEVKFGPAGKMNVPKVIAHVFHIVDDFELAGGRVTEQDHAVFNLAELVMDWWDNTPISQEDRQQKQQQVIQVLTDAGYFKARDPQRQKMTEELVRGIGRDSLGRINPEAMKTLVAVAIRAGYRRGDKNRAIFVKYGLQLLPDLVLEREEERKRIRAAMKRVNQVISVPQRFTHTYSRRVKTLTNDLPGILNPHVVRLAPFSKPSAEILAQFVPNLYGRNRTKIRKALGEDRFQEIRERDSRAIISIVAAFEAAPKDARNAMDTMLVRANGQLGEVLQAEQMAMDEEMEKRRAELAKRKQAVV